jgi:hypothetical protein
MVCIQIKQTPNLQDKFQASFQAVWKNSLLQEFVAPVIYFLCITLQTSSSSMYKKPSHIWTPFLVKE